MGIGNFDDDRDWWWHDGGKPKIRVNCARLADFEDLDEYNVKPGSLKAIIDMLTEVYNGVSKEYRDQTYLTVYSYEHLESIQAEVFYVRDMTPDEKAEENSKETYKKREEEKREKRQYEKLKVKYG